MSASRPTRLSFQNRILLAIATGLGTGYAPRAPGTVGSLLGPALAWCLRVFDLSTGVTITVGVALFLIGVPVCNTGIRLLKADDPQQVVYDEIAAFAWVYLFVPWTWPSVISGFLLFRLFDIAKPWPIRRFERLPGGWGVMADDAVAGLLAGTILWGMVSIW